MKWRWNRLLSDSFRFFTQIIIIPSLIHTSLPAPYKSAMLALARQNIIISAAFNFGISSL